MISVEERKSLTPFDSRDTATRKMVVIIRILQSHKWGMENGNELFEIPNIPLFPLSIYKAKLVKCPYS